MDYKKVWKTCHDYRQLINFAVHKLHMAILRLRVFFQQTLNTLNCYERKRDCMERFEACLEYLPFRSRATVLDVGCHSGWFVLRLADLNYGLCIGVDKDRHLIYLAQCLSAVRKIDNAVFIKMEITGLTVRNLPKVDVTLCLSVFHHWVRQYGVQEALEILEILCLNTRRLIFETGQPDEGSKWAEELIFMGGKDSEMWIRGILGGRMGFNKVVKLGEFSTSVSDVKRGLYCASK